jgi:hypothetical protein
VSLHDEDALKDVVALRFTRMLRRLHRHVPALVVSPTTLPISSGGCRNRSTDAAGHRFQLLVVSTFAVASRSTRGATRAPGRRDGLARTFLPDPHSLMQMLSDRDSGFARITAGGDELNDSTPHRALPRPAANAAISPRVNEAPFEMMGLRYIGLTPWTLERLS